MSTVTQPRLFKSSIELTESQRSQMIELLNSSLAELADLRSHAKHAHWNVKGAHFHALHALFEEIASRLDEHVDEVAERVTALGGVAPGTLRQMAAASNLPQYDPDAVIGEEHLRALARRLAWVAARARNSICAAQQLRDDASADLLTAIVRQADKDLWRLEAHLQTA